MKAAIRCGSVKVAYSSSAEVRNSSLAVTDVTLTDDPPVCDVDVDFVSVGASACLVIDELETYFGVLKPLDGLLPAAC